MKEIDYRLKREIALKFYDESNCKYDGKSYIVHSDMVGDFVEKFKAVFKLDDDFRVTKIASIFHDCIEDAKKTFNDIAKVSNVDVARVVLNVTDVPAEDRFTRHMLTMPKTVTDYRAIILKLADIAANTKYSFLSGSGMYNKYVSEWPYRKAIFRFALNRYKEFLNMEEVDKIFELIDSMN